MSETNETPADEAQAVDETAGLTDAQVIALRSADIHTDEAANDEHVKVFVLPPGAKPTEANGYDHAANMAAARQYAISQGLRPTGDVRLVSIKPFGPGLKSWALTYAVPVTPAERVNDWVGHLAGERGEVVTDDADATAKAEAKAKADEAEAKAKAAAAKTAKASKAKATKPTA